MAPRPRLSPRPRVSSLRLLRRRSLLFVVTRPVSYSPADVFRVRWAAMGFLNLRSRRDIRRLQKRLPALADYDQKAEAARQRLAEEHQRYVTSVSTEAAAASLETCVFLWVLCDALQPRRIADLGSGFSSYLFRTWAHQANAPVEVWSADDDPEWLARTAAFLQGHDLETRRLLSWEAFAAEDRGTFDLVFHDLGSMPTRVRTFGQAILLAGEAGAVLLDDVHKRKKYRQFARDELLRLGRDSYDLKSLLQDRYGRYAWLVLRPEQKG